MHIIILLVFCSLLSLYIAAPSEIDLSSVRPKLSKTVTFAAQPQVTALPQLVAETTHILLHEPALAKLGDVVESVPTAVSHQSQTIVHSRAHRVTPILAPAARLYSAPMERTYATPLMEQARLLRVYPLAPAAAYVHAHAPLQLSTYAAGPACTTYSYAGWGAPLIYAAGSSFLKK